MFMRGEGTSLYDTVIALDNRGFDVIASEGLGRRRARSPEGIDATGLTGVAPDYSSPLEQPTRGLSTALIHEAFLRLVRLSLITLKRAWLKSAAETARPYERGAVAGDSARDFSTKAAPDKRRCGRRWRAF